MHTTLQTLHLSRKQIILVLVVMALLNIFFLTTTGLLNYYYNTAGTGEVPTLLQKYLTDNVIRILALGNLGGENIVASWYSSMLLLLASGTSLLCFSADYKLYTEAKERLLNFGWIGFSLVFALLSLDEAGSFHETIGDSAIFSMIGHESGWTVFLILIGVVAVYMAGFVLIRVRSVPGALVPALLGIMLFASNPIQEEIEIRAMHTIATDELWQRPTWLLLAEEGSEVFASWCLILGMLVYAAKSSFRLNLLNSSFRSGIYIQYKVPGVPAMLTVGLGLCVAGALLTSVLLFAGPPAEDDGIPENWFPSALAFIASSFSVYLATRNSRHRWGYLSLAVFCLGLSVMYATYIYYAFYSLLSLQFGTSIMAVTFIVLSAITAFIWKAEQHLLTRTGVTGWVVLFSATILVGNPYAVEWGFISLSLLVLGLAGAITQPSATKPQHKQKRVQNLSTV